MALTFHFVRFLLFTLSCIGFRLAESKDTRSSLDDDLLLPYSTSHGSAHTHRHVRDCQAIIHGNVTHETHAASSNSRSPVAESKNFVSYITHTEGKSSWVSGHITVVHDPLRTVSILEPGGPGGCAGNRRVTVEETARTRKCLFAQNGGFFNTSNGACLGNIVSDGSLVNNGGGLQNAQFGIRKDGTLVFGYLSEDDVNDHKNPFVQLVSGVVWLLRKGEVYIEQSIQAECSKSQETGSFREFVDVISARTAVGHNADGRLILFHIDGQTGIRGMNLWEVAEFLKTQEVINAINLDGGGSSTYVVNGSLASYPSDHCLDNMWRCPRSVSTVLCVHEPLCQPEDCSGHGRCVEGQCVCHAGWTGPACTDLFSQFPAYGDHGVCTEYGCACDAGWMGSNCSQVCPLGFYGDGCNQTCSCTNGGSCDPVHGRCTCTAGFHGDFCEQECPLGYYGLNCTHLCQCPDMCPCDVTTGSCNVTYKGAIKNTLDRVGHCVANQMWSTWKQEQEAHTPKPYLTEQTWLIISVVLFTLLLVSVGGNMLQACRKWEWHTHRQGYSYTPLGKLNGGVSQVVPQTEELELNKTYFQLEESDSS